MSSISCARNSYTEIEANRIHLGTPLVSAAGVQKIVQLFAVALTSASLAACAQSSVVTNKSDFLAPSRPASLEDNRKATNKHATETRVASFGLASFYAHGIKTASGEKFNPHELTAAHRTLPFGTRLRVTNLATGRFVTVRVNDRGPFIPGRVVDVSYSAAETLGMVGRGITKVKLDVVQ
jgi:rare lipoprotein A